MEVHGPECIEPAKKIIIELACTVKAGVIDIHCMADGKDYPKILTMCLLSCFENGFRFADTMFS